MGTTYWNLLIVCSSHLVLTYTALDMQDSELPIFRDYDGLPVDLHSHEPSRSPSPSFSETEVPMLLDESHTVKEIEEIQCYDRRLKRKHGPKIVEEDKTASDLLVTENAAAQEGWIDMRALEGEPRTKDDKLCSGIAKVDVQAPTTVRLLDLDDLEGRNAEKCESGQDSGGSFVSNPWAEEDVACARRFAFGTPYPENQWADTASSCRDAEVGKP